MKSKKKTDLRDSPRDEARMKPEKAELNLPDAEEIPGQEHVHVPPPGEMADTTISSADEEGKRVLDNPADVETDADSSDVSAEERKVLDDATNRSLTRDQANLDSAQLDQVDEEGEPLNEPTGLSGRDLDVPGSELDDANEDLGEEDEENNSYSVDEENEDNDINTRQ